MQTQYKNEIKEELNKILKEQKLNPLFQPIVNLSHQEIYGYEGLIRGPSGSILHSPEKLFEVASHFGRLVELDFLCRSVIIKQFSQLNLPGKLFININPESLLGADYEDGKTLSYVKKAKIKPENVVIEITETHPIESFSLIRNALNHYRKAGFTIAIDDLGSGYSSLKLWSELHPDFVKIDRHFINSIDTDKVKRHFVSSIFEIAGSIGCRVISEGVETIEEYAMVRNLGSEFVQGYYFSRPEPIPIKNLNKFLFRSSQRIESVETTPTAKNLCQKTLSVNVTETLSEIAELFMRMPSEQSLVVIEDNKPLGLVTRVQVLDILSSRFGRALYARRPICLFTKKDILIVPSHLSLETLSDRITSAVDMYVDEFIIVEKGKLLGKGSFIDLLKEITELRVESARYANPLTMLPGNVPIQKKLKFYLADNIDFAAVYCDLDNFKPYNDYYGYRQGDEVLKLLSQILRKHLEPGSGFIGHIGGDDFMLFITHRKWHNICHKILTQFNKKIVEMYNKADRNQGYIKARDRFNKQQQYPIMSLSLGVVLIAKKHNQTAESISSYATKAKSEAKKITGSSISYVQTNGSKELKYITKLVV